MKIEVQQILGAVATMQADLEAYNAAESAALAKRAEAAVLDQESTAKKQTALASIANVQTILADVQLRNQPAPDPVAIVEPNHEL